MGEDTVTRSKSGGPLKTAALVFSAGLLSFFGNYVLTRISDLEQENAKLHEEIGVIKTQEAQWGTLAELKEETIRNRIELEVTQRVFEYEFGRKIPRARRVPPGNHPEDEEVAPPEAREVEPDAFRRIQQQKYSKPK